MRARAIRGIDGRSLNSIHTSGSHIPAATWKVEPASAAGTVVRASSTRPPTPVLCDDDAANAASPRILVAVAAQSFAPSPIPSVGGGASSRLVPTPRGRQGRLCCGWRTEARQHLRELYYRRDTRPMQRWHRVVSRRRGETSRRRRVPTMREAVRSAVAPSISSTPSASVPVSAIPAAISAVAPTSATRPFASTVHPLLPPPCPVSADEHEHRRPPSPPTPPSTMLRSALPRRQSRQPASRPQQPRRCERATSARARSRGPRHLAEFAHRHARPARRRTRTPLSGPPPTVTTWTVPFATVSPATRASRRSSHQKCRRRTPTVPAAVPRGGARGGAGGGVGRRAAIDTGGICGRTEGVHGRLRSPFAWCLLSLATAPSRRRSSTLPAPAATLTALPTASPMSATPPARCVPTAAASTAAASTAAASKISAASTGAGSDRQSRVGE